MLRDIGGLDSKQEREVPAWAARALVDADLAEQGRSEPRACEERR
ncbi:hypothetical protein Franean1_3385 [Parafrankia sp. EAN1pec]|nr:hypothetical protein Franean1_3385 [Frankia sp. EAN1pec]